jgi:transcriptional regulator with PAS, ATPase and Fis domain
MRNHNSSIPINKLKFNMKKTKDKPKKKWPPYTRWYDKIHISKALEEEDKRLKQACRDLGIDNIIW